MLNCPHCQENIKSIVGISQCPNCSGTIEIKPIKRENEKPLLFEEIGKESLSSSNRKIAFWSKKIVVGVASVLGATFGALLVKTTSLKTILSFVAFISFIYLLREILKIAFNPLDKKLERFAEEKRIEERQL